MKILKFIYYTYKQAFYRWAEREIDKTHPDVPDIVMKRQEYEDKARRLFA